MIVPKSRLHVFLQPKNMRTLETFSINKFDARLKKFLQNVIKKNTYKLNSYIFQE
jgi:hypothetical protein